MPDNRVPASTVVALWALIVISILAVSVARADDVGMPDHLYPLGFDYRPLQAANQGTDWFAVTGEHHLPFSSLIELSHPLSSPADRTIAISYTDDDARDAAVDMKSAFKSLQAIKRNEERLARGQASLLSFFDTGENALGRQVGADFFADPIEHENREIPETLAMLLLGTGLIGLARIQRRHMKD